MFHVVIVYMFIWVSDLSLFLLNRKMSRQNNIPAIMIVKMDQKIFFNSFIINSNLSIISELMFI